MTKANYDHDVELEYSDPIIPEHRLIIALIVRAYLDIGLIVKEIQIETEFIQREKQRGVCKYEKVIIDRIEAKKQKLLEWWFEKSEEKWTVSWIFDHLPLENPRGLLAQIRKNIKSGKVGEVVEFRKLARQINMKNYPHKNNFKNDID
jgi:hypothetical protein